MDESPSRIKRILKDPLYKRVCHIIFAIPLLALGVVAVVLFPPSDLKILVATVICVIAAIYGGWLMHAAIFGSDDELESATNGMSDGGELFVLVIVIVAFIFALPITAAIRFFKPRISKQV